MKKLHQRVDQTITRGESLTCVGELSISKGIFDSVSVSHQGEEKAVQNCEKLLADLRRRSTTIAPLKLRRNTPNKSITVESLCDWEADKVALRSLSDNH